MSLKSILETQLIGDVNTDGDMLRAATKREDTAQEGPEQGRSFATWKNGTALIHSIDSP